MIVGTLRACYPTLLVDTIGQGAFKDQKLFAAYAVESAKFMTKYSLSVGDGKGSFSPTANCTRQEAIIFLMKAYAIRDTFIHFREVETTVKDGIRIERPTIRLNLMMPFLVNGSLSISSRTPLPLIPIKGKLHACITIPSSLRQTASPKKQPIITKSLPPAACALHLKINGQRAWSFQTAMMPSRPPATISPR